MEEREERMIASVLDKDPELRKYYKEHLEYEKRLAGLSDRGYLSPKDEMEKKRIQKLWQEFNSLEAIKDASLNELKEKTGFSEKLSKAIQKCSSLE